MTTKNSFSGFGSVSKRIIVAVLCVGIFFAVPLVASAVWIPGQPILPDCSKTNYTSEGGLNPTNPISNPCGWSHLVLLASNILQFLLYLAVPVAIIAFAYAGWLYLSSRGNPAQITKAHGIFLNVVIGVVVVLVAWVVVYEILKILEPGSFIGVLDDL